MKAQRSFTLFLLVVSIALALVILISSLSTANTCERGFNDNDHGKDGLSERLDIIEASLAPLYITGTYGIRTLVHESGHVFFTGLSGASWGEISEYHFFWGKASYQWDYQPAAWQRLMASGGGLISTRITAEITDLMLDQGVVPAWLRKVASSYYLCARFDIPNYILKSSFDRFLLGRTAPGDDIFAISNTVSEWFLPDVGIPEERQKKKRLIVNGLYLVWIVASGVDLYLDFTEIVNNFNRTLGRKINPGPFDETGLDFTLRAQELGFSYSW